MAIFENLTSSTEISYTNCPPIPPGGATVSVGALNLKPAPFVSLTIEQYKVNDIVVGGALIVNLNGTVVGNGFADVSSQIYEILQLGTSTECVPININCNGASVVNGLGRVRNVSGDEGPQPSWVNIAAYTMEIEVFENNGETVVKPDPTFSDWITENEIIKNISETINLSVDSDAYNVDSAPGIGRIGKAHAKCSFSISVSGAATSSCSSGNKKVGLDAAEEVMKRRLDGLSNMQWNLAKLGAPQIHGELQQYRGGARRLHFRSVEVNPFDSTITVNGDIIYRPAACQYPNVFMDVSADSSTSNDDQGRTVTISGNIQGLSNDEYSTIIFAGGFAGESNIKMPSAESAYGAISGGLLAMAKAYLMEKIEDPCSDADPEGGSAPCKQMEDDQKKEETECDIRLVSKSVTRNFGEGSINFNHTYSTQKNCSIPGAKNVDIEVTRNKPTDVTAEFTVIGRGYPLIQDLNTKTRETVAISASASLDNNDCSLASSTDSSTIEACLQGLIDQQKAKLGVQNWFIIRDTSSVSTNGTIRLDQEFLRPSCFNV